MAEEKIDFAVVSEDFYQISFHLIQSKAVTHTLILTISRQDLVKT